MGRKKVINNRIHLILTVVILLFVTVFSTACGDESVGSGSDPLGSFIQNKGSDEKATPSSSTEDSSTNVTTSENSGPVRDNTPIVLTGQADGIKGESSGNVIFDFSNTSDGYVMFKYNGDKPLVRTLITIPDGTVYDYAVMQPYGVYITYPLTGGDGNYNISIKEVVDVELQKYSTAFSLDFSVTLKDEFEPFLRPNTYVDFNENSNVVAKGKQLAEGAHTDLDVVANIYNFVVKNVKYDDKKAEAMKWPYVPVVDETLATGKGICFDYASLMASMLRSQGIPTKVVFGYVDEVYHAWISCYLSEVGWVDNLIEFDGVNWKMMDPTFAAGSSNSALKKFIGDGSKYTQKFQY